MSCGGIDRNSLIYCQGWFLVFQPCSVWDTSGSWLSILSLSGGPVLSQGQQSLGYGNATQTALNGLRTLLLQLQGVEQIFHILSAHPALAVLSRAICSLYAWGDSSACLPRVPQLKGEKSRENWEIFLSAEDSFQQHWDLPAPFRTATIYAYVLPGFHKRWVIKFIINNKLC